MLFFLLALASTGYTLKAPSLRALMEENRYISLSTCEISRNATDHFGRPEPLTGEAAKQGKFGKCIDEVISLHVPTYEFVLTGQEYGILVNHPVQQKGHWIEWVIITNQRDELVDFKHYEEPANATVKGPVQTRLFNYDYDPNDEIHVFAFCNLHGLWEGVLGPSEPELRRLDFENAYVNTTTCEVDPKAHVPIGKEGPFTSATTAGCFKTVGALHLATINITTEPRTKDRLLNVIVPHPVQEKGHWIEWIFLVSFNLPGTEGYISHWAYMAEPAGKDKANPVNVTFRERPEIEKHAVKPYAFCNLHGLWEGDEVMAR